MCLNLQSEAITRHTVSFAVIGSEPMAGEAANQKTAPQVLPPATAQTSSVEASCRVCVFVTTIETPPPAFIFLHISKKTTTPSRAFSLNVLRNASAAVEKGVDMMTLIQVSRRGRLRVFGAPVATDR